MAKVAKVASESVAPAAASSTATAAAAVQDTAGSDDAQSQLPPGHPERSNIPIDTVGTDVFLGHKMGADDEPGCVRLPPAELPRSSAHTLDGTAWPSQQQQKEEVGPTDAPLPGSWTCSKCRNVRRPVDEKCYDCEEPRPHDSIAAEEAKWAPSVLFDAAETAGAESVAATGTSEEQGAESGGERGVSGGDDDAVAVSSIDRMRDGWDKADLDAGLTPLKTLNLEPGPLAEDGTDSTNWRLGMDDDGSSQDFAWFKGKLEDTALQKKEKKVMQKKNKALLKQKKEKLSTTAEQAGEGEDEGADEVDGSSLAIEPVDVDEEDDGMDNEEAVAAVVDAVREMERQEAAAKTARKAQQQRTAALAQGETKPDEDQLAAKERALLVAEDVKEEADQVEAFSRSGLDTVEIVLPPFEPPSSLRGLLNEALPEGQQAEHPARLHASYYMGHYSALLSDNLSPAILPDVMICTADPSLRGLGPDEDTSTVFDGDSTADENEWSYVLSRLILADVTRTYICNPHHNCIRISGRPLTYCLWLQWYSQLRQRRQPIELRSG